MTELLFSDEELGALRSLPKRVTNPQARWSEKPGHRQRNHEAVSGDAALRFRIYLRQNLKDEKDFSCGLALVQRGGEFLSLARYNGGSHRHGEVAYRPHVHRATEKALADGKRIDSHAEEADEYHTLEGALACLIKDCAVRGLSAEPDHPRLF